MAENKCYYGIERKKDDSGKNLYGVWFVINDRKCFLKGVFPTRQKAVRSCQHKCGKDYFSDYEIKSIK